MTSLLRRPLAIVASFSLMVIAGLVSIFSLPVELLPSLKHPRLVIITSFGNASAEEVESILTRPLEEAVGTVAGLRSITSTSSEGTSSVTLRFDWGQNMSLAAAEVREKLDLVADELPKETKLPVVVQYDPTDSPIVTLALTGPQDLTELYTLARNYIKPELETISGVASVRIHGGLVPEVQVLVDAGRLVAQSVDLKTITDRLESSNINFPGGSLFQGSMEIPVRTVGRFKSLDEIERISLGRGAEGGTIRVKDVANVVLTQADRTSLSRLNGKPAILLGIIKEPSGNTLDVSDKVLTRMNYIRERIPPDSSLEVVENEGPFIQQALDELKVDILWGSLLAFGVLLVFLGNLRSTFLIMLTIPVSVVSTFALMSFYGVSLNMMSIGGMALGVGMLVDCSIVVLEAIHRKQGSASDVYSSISSALTEVGPSIVSGTLTSLAVLVPILFMTGIAQKLFRDFALTMGSSLFFSLLVSIFLLPAISVLIKTSSNRSHDDVGFMQPLNDLYKHSLTLALDNPRKVIAATVALVLLATSGIYRVGFELFPNLNLDVFDVNITLEPGSSLNKLEERIDSVENIIGTMPEVRNYVTKAGVDRNRSAMDASLETGKINEARINVRLNPQSSGRNETDTVIGELKRQIKPIDGAKIDFTLTQGPIARILGAGDKPELLRISGDNFDELQRLSSELENVLVTNKHISGMSWEGNVRTDHYQIVVDRYKAASTGVTVDDIAHAVKAGIEGKNVGKFIQGDHEHDIRVRLKTREKTSPDDLENLALRSIHDDFSVLGRLATVSTGHGPREIIRSDRQRNVILHGAISGIAASDAERIVMDAARKLELPPGYSARPGASRMELMESMGNLSIAILLASLLVYTILVIQFESLIWPLLVFTVVPASMIGPAIALNVGNHPVNIFVLIGTVVLIGIVVNMGILMVATINEFRESGSTLRSAIINGCAVRLRPILMTTATTVFGALPICVASGVANQLNQPLAITIISGLLASTLFKLYGLPVLYEIVAESRQSLKS